MKYHMEKFPNETISSKRPLKENNQNLFIFGGKTN